MTSEKFRVLEAYSKLPKGLLVSEYNLYAKMLMKGESEPRTMQLLKEYINKHKINIEV